MPVSSFGSDFLNFNRMKYIIIEVLFRICYDERAKRLLVHSYIESITTLKFADVNPIIREDNFLIREHVSDFKFMSASPCEILSTEWWR